MMDKVQKKNFTYLLLWINKITLTTYSCFWCVILTMVNTQSSLNYYAIYLTSKCVIPLWILCS